MTVDNMHRKMSSMPELQWYTDEDIYHNLQVYICKATAASYLITAPWNALCSGEARRSRTKWISGKVHIIRCPSIQRAWGLAQLPMTYDSCRLWSAGI